MTITKREAQIIEDLLLDISEVRSYGLLDAEEALLLERVKEFIKENEQ